MTADHAAVFERFGIPAQESVYPYAPVFQGVVGGRPVAVKRTHDAEAMGRWVRRLRELGVPVVTPVAGPYEIGDATWVAYPWVEGRGYEGTRADVAAAGDLLGRLHAAGTREGLKDFEWPDHDAASVQEDVDGLAPYTDRFEQLLRDFMTTTLPAVRDADLPVAEVSMDFKAANLVYSGDGPVLVDPDNGERAPRLLDLALAALLFHNDLEGEPARLFTEQEWAVFRDAYLARVELTERERAVWPTALLYMMLEWGVWTAINGEWQVGRHARFLADLLSTDLGRFTL
ncbi:MULTISPECIES: phosphotransferase enzyme family protein [Nonomuraea]|uniref:Phosphotransferase enzyme family protein n=1 Tax=Nonomuraea mangrovi TaxID=2316207 RepID=A0ABW4T5K8_9ACTN